MRWRDLPVTKAMTDSTSSTSPDASTNDGEIVVYWRPGCGFCSSLRSKLDKAQVPHRLVNIWDEPAGAATVRSIAKGNETVPTVEVGSVGMVNPSLAEIMAAAATHAPSAVPEGYEPPEPSAIAKVVTKFLGGGN